MKIMRIGAVLCITASSYAAWQPHDQIGVATNAEKSWVVGAPRLQCDVAYQAFDGGGVKNGLDTLVFGKKDFTVGDVYLASRLANTALQTDINANNWYSLIANSILHFSLKQQRFAFSLDASKTFTLGNGNLLCTLGVAVPIEYYEHAIQFSMRETALGTDILENPPKVATLSGTPGDSIAASMFFKKYGSIESFFNIGVLQPKGLGLPDSSRTVHMSTIRLNVALDFAPYWDEQIQKMQLGFMIGCPTGDVPASESIWDVENGSSNAFRLGAFGAVEWNFLDTFRPFLTVEYTCDCYSNVHLRIPKKKTIAANASYENSGIIYDSSISNRFILLNFSDYETAINHFADTKTLCNRRRGGVATVRLGMAISTSACDVGCWYDLRHKSKDAVKIDASVSDYNVSGLYDIKTVTNSTNEMRHSVGWHVKYPIKENLTFATGSQHVLRGANTPQYHTFSMGIDMSF